MHKPENAKWEACYRVPGEWRRENSAGGQNRWAPFETERAMEDGGKVLGEFFLVGGER